MSSYRDEDGEPLMDYDEMQSDGGQSPEPHHDDFLEDDVDGWGEQARERSQTPVYDVDKVGKPRKRLVKKSDSGMGTKENFVVPELVDEDEDGEFGRDYAMEAKKRKKLGKEGSGSIGKDRKKFSKGEKKYSSNGGKGGSSSKSGLMKKGMYSGKLAGKEDGEVKEMWDTIAGGDSEVLSFPFLLFLFGTLIIRLSSKWMNCLY